MIFQHTYREPRMWRGWLKNGQSVEISWDKQGWDFGAGVHIHSNDSDMGDRMLFLKLWRLTVIIPLGIVDHPWPAMDGPQWSAYASQEFGLTFRWGLKSKSFNWPFHVINLAWDYECQDGTWQDVRTCDRFNTNGEYDPRPNAKREVHDFWYTLRSHEVQERKATIHRERWTQGRHILSKLGWPKKIHYDIEISFDGEVGERAGSWKGGCIGCSYRMEPGETMLDTLQRMEAKREFR